MSNLIDHARRELELQGMMLEDSDYGGNAGKAVLELIEVFSKQGHSGGSAHLVAYLFHQLSEYKALGPVTDDPHEWHDHGLLSENTWQNLRDSRCFSNDAGLTYFIVDEPKKHRWFFGHLPKRTQVWVWNNHRTWIQTLHTSKISGLR